MSVNGGLEGYWKHPAPEPGCEKCYYSLNARLVATNYKQVSRHVVGQVPVVYTDPWYALCSRSHQHPEGWCEEYYFSANKCTEVCVLPLCRLQLLSRPRVFTVLDFNKVHMPLVLGLPDGAIRSFVQQHDPIPRVLLTADPTYHAMIDAHSVASGMCHNTTKPELFKNVWYAPEGCFAGVQYGQFGSVYSTENFSPPAMVRFVPGMQQLLQLRGWLLGGAPGSIAGKMNAGQPENDYFRGCRKVQEK
eukprot:1160516-Pelagomonas_calceolata.AAC.2